MQTTVDQKVYRVASNSGTNYYRVRLNSYAVNGKAYFKAGLYPAYAVDMFRGQESELPTELIDAETNMRRQVVSAQTNALKKYLEADDSAALEKATKDLVRVQEIVLGQGNTMIGDKSTVRMQFNPLEGLTDYTVNKKFVIALSSDPDAILNQISAFVEEAKTTETIQDAVTAQLAGIVVPEVERSRLRDSIAKAVVSALDVESKREDISTSSQFAELIATLNAQLEGLK
jgi:hypothetical protein